jgi:alkanesulfonate monooxygenase SsuD/methylene tetrahydromethanopterin reductase-like flavin-dependent oxidoreductase (luciferase family)
MTVIKGLAEGREVIHHGQPLQIPRVRDGALPVWMAAYGPKALRLVGEQADGFILQTADPGNPSTDFVPDEIVDRFCLLGPGSAHIERLREHADVGADQFALYLMHDDEENTLDAYGSEIIPALT